MHNRTLEALATPHVGGKLAVAIFILTLLAVVIESELTQYVQTTLGYRQPFFLFYLVHSSFTIIFPLHLLYLLATTNHSAIALMKGLAIAISNHMAPPEKSTRFVFPTAKFLSVVLAMTFGYTWPSLLWFASVSMASMADVTAIGNTNAFFVYIISVKVFKLRWEPKRLLAIVFATMGTVAVVYGGATASTDEPTDIKAATTPSFSIKPSAPLLGNLLTLLASFGYGLYQVFYKIYAALPSDPEAAAERQYESIPEDDEENISLTAMSLANDNTINGVDASDAVYPPPFGFHPNLLTTLLGFFTLTIMWIPIPFLHWSGVEIFRLPSNARTVFSIACIALSGVVFNSGFMLLLGLWGPIIVSVGNLLTIVLVLISDVLFGAGVEVLTFWSLVGSGGIVIAFGVLASDMFTKK